MNGLNDRFKRRPENFLAEVALQEVAELETARTPEGVYDFDFQPTTSPTIVLFGLPRPKIDPGEELIRAYWLPWRSGTTLQLELRPDANYFFTSHLGGCEIRIVPPAGVGTYTKVLHIAGDTPKGKAGGPAGMEWRAQQAVDALTPSEWHRSLSFSSTDPYPKGYKDSSDVQVIGFKNKHRWELWAQETDEKGYTVTRHWRIY